MSEKTVNAELTERLAAAEDTHEKEGQAWSLKSYALEARLADVTAERDALKATDENLLADALGEIERLKGERDALDKQVNAAVSAGVEITYHAETKEAKAVNLREAELERLREALREISKFGDSDIQQVAAAALGADEGRGEG